MRIAVSGTHGSGKSTLIDAFLARHRDFAHEPEPYAVLQELYGEDFGESPAVEDFRRQLDVNLETLRRYHAGERVLFERSPVDFLAYMFALDDRNGRRRDLQHVVTVRAAISRLDAIVFLPLDEGAGLAVPESEDLELREAVDEELQEILLADGLDLFATGQPVVIEARGTIDQRLVALERLLL